jgi:hypothetical protein
MSIMLEWYLGALAFGGTLLVASLVLGGGHHGGADHGHGHGKDTGVGLAWMPITSLRFWTFFLGFGGAAGSLLSWLTGTGAAFVGVASAAVGWVSGVAVVAAMRAAEKGVDSEVRTSDLRGETASVTVAIEPGKFGKIRLSIKGRIVDLAAESDTAFANGAKVMIVGDGADGRVQVTAI